MNFVNFKKLKVMKFDKPDYYLGLSLSVNTEDTSVSVAAEARKLLEEAKKIFKEENFLDAKNILIKFELVPENLREFKEEDFSFVSYVNVISSEIANWLINPNEALTRERRLDVPENLLSSVYLSRNALKRLVNNELWLEDRGVNLIIETFSLKKNYGYVMVEQASKAVEKEKKVEEQKKKSKKKKNRHKGAK